MRKRIEISIWSAVVIASLGLHAVAFGGWDVSGGDGFGRTKARPPSLVEMTVTPRPPAPVVPLPAAAAPAIKPRRQAVSRPNRTRAPVATARPPAAPPPAEETPADFTGVTLTNDAVGAAWASATGNGDAMRGALGRPGARVTHRTVDGNAGAARHGDGTPVVGLADLSRPPVAPDLRSVLERLYPPDARARGVAGKAIVRARIMPNGHVRELALLSESAPGFGDACQRTLRGSQWPPPLDRAGAAVSTFINYTCRFNVQ